MPTNRKRISRRSNRIPLIFSDEYVAHLKMKDFLGELSQEEILVAKKLHIYRWDQWMKNGRKDST
jgi:hypothetical protein